MVLRDDVLLLGRLTPPSPRRVASSPLRVWREGRRSPCIFCPVHRKSLGLAKGRSILPPQYPFFFEHLHFPFAAVMAAATAFASLRSLWSCVLTVGLSRCSFNRYSYGTPPRPPPRARPRTRTRTSRAHRTRPRPPSRGSARPRPRPWTRTRTRTRT